MIGSINMDTDTFNIKKGWGRWLYRLEKKRKSNEVWEIREKK